MSLNLDIEVGHNHKHRWQSQFCLQNLTFSPFEIID